MRIMRFPLHSVLLGIYPILHLYARNIAFIPFLDTMRSLEITLGFTFFFLIGFRIIVKSWQKAGLLCSMLLFMFFSFGHIANLLESWFSKKDIPFDVPLFAWIRLVLCDRLECLAGRTARLFTSGKAVSFDGLSHPEDFHGVQTSEEPRTLQLHVRLVPSKGGVLRMHPLSSPKPGTARMLFSEGRRENI